MVLTSKAPMLAGVPRGSRRSYVAGKVSPGTPGIALVAGLLNRIANVSRGGLSIPTGPSSMGDCAESPESSMGLVWVRVVELADFVRLASEQILYPASVTPLALSDVPERIELATRTTPALRKMSHPAVVPTR